MPVQEVISQSHTSARASCTTVGSRAGVHIISSSFALQKCETAYFASGEVLN